MDVCETLNYVRVWLEPLAAVATFVLSFIVLRMNKRADAEMKQRPHKAAGRADHGGRRRPLYERADIESPPPQGGSDRFCIHDDLSLQFFCTAAGQGAAECLLQHLRALEIPKKREYSMPVAIRSSITTLRGITFFRTPSGTAGS